MKKNSFQLSFKLSINFLFSFCFLSVFFVPKMFSYVNNSFGPSDNSHRISRNSCTIFFELRSFCRKVFLFFAAFGVWKSNNKTALLKLKYLKAWPKIHKFVPTNWKMYKFYNIRQHINQHTYHSLLIRLN